MSVMSVHTRTPSVIQTKSKPKTKKITLTLNGSAIELSDAMIINPFFTGVDGGSVVSLDLRSLYQNYKNIYVMCIKDDVEMNDSNRKSIMNIYSKLLSRDDLVDSCKYFKLIKAPASLMRNFFLRKRANLVPGPLLQELYPVSEDRYDVDAIVSPMFEMTESKVLSYIQMYCTDTTINKLSTALSFVSYYNKYNSYMFNEKIRIMIKTIDTLCHWRNPDNCNINMDVVFNKRSFTYNGHRLDQIRYTANTGAKTINNVLDNIDQRKKSLVKTDDDYLAAIRDDDKTFRKAEHMNICQVLKESENRTFYATIDEGQFGFTKDDIADLFDNITNEQYRFELFNTMLVSKELCHFVINNKRVLIRNSDLFQKYKPLYSYLFGYAWLTMYLEESIFTTKATKNHRFAFDIDTAYNLPVFPFTMENVHSNPYVSLLLSRDLIDPKTNCMSINALEDYNKYYGVCSNEEALKRFNTFISGRHDINIFNGIDPNIFSISGSVIPACLQKRSPLMDLCTNTDDMIFDDAYGTYFNHYYSESDVDVMCGVNTMSEFFNHASIFLEKLVSNLSCKRSDLRITPNKKMAIIITKHFFKECVHDLNGELGTDYTPETLIKLFDEGLSSDISSNDSISDSNTNNLPKDIINYFYADYVQEKNELVKKWRLLQEQTNTRFDQELLSSFNTITSPEEMAIKMVSYDITEEDTNKRDSEVYYYVNDFRDEDDKVPKNRNYMVFKFSETIKYKISSDGLKRVVEIFKVSPMDPFNTVARFHKPCVRAYYQGGRFYMLPSFITAVMTLINIDYKYFAGSRDPIEIVNKYRMRGYSVILNPNEKKSIMMYNKHVDSTNGMFKITEDAEAFGPKDLNNKIFKPIVYKQGLPAELYTISKHRYINSITDLKNVYDREVNVKNCPINILDYNTINKSGCIAPLQMWIADAFYDHVNRTDF